MARAWRHSICSARRGGSVAAVVALALLAAVPAAGDDGPPGADGVEVDGLAFDAGRRLYAADRDGDRVLVLGAAGEMLGELGGGALAGAAAGELRGGRAPGPPAAPAGVAGAPSGDALVADRHGVQRFGADGA